MSHFLVGSGQRMVLSTHGLPLCAVLCVIYLLDPGDVTAS